MKNILPVAYPIITTFTGYADALAILCGFEKGLEWVYSHYIKIQVNDIVNRNNDENDLMRLAMFTSSFFNDFDGRKQVNVLCDSIFLGLEKCPHLYSFEIPNDYINKIDDDFIEFIKKAINDNYYLYGYVNTYYISNYGTDISIGHPIFIFGYDDITQTIDFADFLDNGVYTFAKCSYDELRQAYAKIEDVDIPDVKSFALIQYRDKCNFTCNYFYIRESIREYIYPSVEDTRKQNEYTMSFFESVGWVTQTYMGVDVYEYFGKFIDDEIALGKNKIDIRLFNAMFEHKKLMMARLAFLQNKDWLPESKQNFIQQYGKVKDEWLIVRNYILKYNAKASEKIINKVKDILTNTKKLEIELLKKIFDI